MKNLELDTLTTESRNKNTEQIDQVSTEEMLEMMNGEDKKVPLAVEKELPQIAKAVDEIVKRMKQGGRLFYFGAGTSGRLGILDASECPPTYGVSETLVQGVIAGGVEAIFRAQEGAEDSQELGKKDLLERQLSSKDVVVGIAASGRTPYVIGGLDYAKEVGAFRISLTCNGDSAVAKHAEVSIAPVVGPEVITGSTRLKSGTAQKLVLNMLSTGTMIKLGKVYGNLMVDVQSTNEKLVERGKKIVVDATGVSLEESEIYLKETQGNVKLAIFMILSKLPLEKAIPCLEKYDGYIAQALRHSLETE